MRGKGHNFSLFWGPACLALLPGSDDTDYDNELSTFIIRLSDLEDLTLVIIKGEGVDRKKTCEPIKNYLSEKVV